MSSLPKKITQETVVALNSSGEWSGPPEYVRLKVPFEYNDTHTVKYFHYALSPHVRHQEPMEPELEQKVCYCPPVFFLYVLYVSYPLWCLGRGGLAFQTGPG